MARIGDFLGAMSMEQFFGQSPLESHINGGRGALIKVKFLTVTLTLQRKYTHKKLMHCSVISQHKLCMLPKRSTAKEEEKG